jgi:tetratricopeptide (TPR) repeat protein
MRIFLPSIILVLFGYSAFSLATSDKARTDSLMARLKVELSKRKEYDSQKESRIRNLKIKLAAVSHADLNTQYNICGRLYEEYKVYQFDSAYVYTQKLISISQRTKDPARLNESELKVGFLLMSAGMFKETFECLNHINTALLDSNFKLQYYSIKSRAYSDLAEYNNDRIYSLFDRAEAVKYIDSAIALAKPNSFERLYHQGNKLVITGKLQQPSPEYIRLLDHYNLTPHQRAMVATGLSSFYEGPYQMETRTNLMLIGAINDIISSTKETTAIFRLGQQLYLDGNLKDSYTFIQQAMDDAQYYGARLRKIKIGAVLPLVAAQKIILTENEKNKMESEKDRFLIYFLLITAVAILIALISFIVFIQLKRLKVKERIIEEKNIQLEKINDKLIEDTHIKEEYIGYFFNVISGYILKLEKLKRNIERKLATKKYEDILVTVNEINIKKERETLFYTFDHIFLKIFPNFIPTFNSLLKKEDQVWPKDHEVLNTDLRIFALMRLGINDNETIANILEYSVNTIYVYKMRIKAKALVPHDQFDQKIMSIKAVEVLNKS